MGSGSSTASGGGSARERCRTAEARPVELETDHGGLKVTQVTEVQHEKTRLGLAALQQEVTQMRQLLKQQEGLQLELTMVKQERKQQEIDKMELQLELNVVKEQSLSLEHHNNILEARCSELEGKLSFADSPPEPRSQARALKRLTDDKGETRACVAGKTDLKALMAELYATTSLALVKRAEDMGIERGHVAAADEAHDRKDALVDLILTHTQSNEVAAASQPKGYIAGTLLRSVVNGDLVAVEHCIAKGIDPDAQNEQLAD